MKKFLSYSLILGVVFSIIAVGTVSPTSSQVQAAENNKVDVFVSFDKAPGASEHAIVERAGGTVRFSYTIVPAVAASVPGTSIQGLLNNPRVKSVELDGKVYAVDAELESAWGVKRIGSGTVHDSGNKGTGVKIGIIDSGVDYLHQDLDGVYVGGYDFVDGDDDPMDVYGHGTHVAGTACAEDNDLGVVGVAPECALYSLRVLNDSGVGSWSATIAAMDWAVLNGLQVVNLSLGSSRDPGSTVKAAFDNAEAAGLVIVAAGGNSGKPSGKGNNVIYPAKYASVIAVAATDKNDTRPSWSSTGEEIELAAPGVSVLSTWNDGTSPHDPQPYILGGDYYKEGSGTSMASPHVAGAAALVIAAGVTNNDDVRAILTSTADDIGATGRDTHYGYGLVNVAAAIASIAPPSSAVNVDVSTDKTNYESETAIVNSITYTPEGGRNGDKHLNIRVSVIVAAKKSDAGQQPAAIQPAKNQEQKLGFPKNAVEVSPGVFYLGKSMDKGKVVEGYAFVHYAKDGKQAKANKPAWDDTYDKYKFLIPSLELKWAETMQYQVNTDGSDMSDDDTMNAISASLETWDTETSFELFNDDLPTTTTGFDSGDRFNRVTWDDLGSSGIIAANYLWFNPALKTIVESDVRFNSYYTWDDCTGDADCTSSGSEKMDLQNIATHEFGHNGLNDLYMSPSIALTMHGWSYGYGETDKRTLGTGDELGIQALYGE